MGAGIPHQAGSPSDPSKAGMWGQQARASSLRGSWGRGRGRDHGEVETDLKGEVCVVGRGARRNGLKRKRRGQRPGKGKKLGVETV